MDYSRKRLNAENACATIVLQIEKSKQIPAPTTKIELPLTADHEIVQLVEAFESCALPIAHWTHRAHLAVGAYYARTLPFDQALQMMRSGIQRYNAANQNPTGYNETITRLFLIKMVADIRTGAAAADLADELQRLTSVCNLEWLYHYYSRALLHSALAKGLWVEPDLCALDFSAE